MANSATTKRDIYNAIIAGTISADELKAFATAEIEKLDAANAKRREKNIAKREELKPLMEQILDVLADGSTKFCSEIASAIEVSPQKATSVLKVMVEEKMVVKGEAKAPKKGIQKTYTKA